jgi:hypothetical protein
MISVTKANVEKALDEIDRGGLLGVPRKRRSTKHCLLARQGHYHPKYVLMRAHILQTGRKPKGLTGGCASNVALRSHYLPPKGATDKAGYIRLGRRRSPTGFSRPNTNAGGTSTSLTSHRRGSSCAMQPATFEGRRSHSVVLRREVEFWRKDLKEKRWAITRYSTAEFVAALAEHVSDHYRHAIRHFGLWAPRAKRHRSAAMFALLGQKQRPLPQRLGWAHSSERILAKIP